MAFEKIKYGQVEPNHLSAQRTGQIYAQLPANSEITTLENGMFVKYDLANGEVNYSGVGEWMLVFNEIKLYDERKQMYKDYAMKAEDFNGGVIVPRVFKTNVGDIYTTNMVVEANYSEGEILTVGTDGILKKGNGDMEWQVAKVYNLADGQPAIKVVRVK